MTRSSPEPSFHYTTVIPELLCVTCRYTPDCGASQRWERMSFSCLCHSADSWQTCCYLSHCWTAAATDYHVFLMAVRLDNGNVLCTHIHSHSQPRTYVLYYGPQGEKKVDLSKERVAIFRFSCAIDNILCWLNIARLFFTFSYVCPLQCFSGWKMDWKLTHHLTYYHKVIRVVY